MSIYDIDFQQQTNELLPPSKRNATTLAFLKVYGDCLQFNHDLIFIEYADGFVGGTWAVMSAYSKGDRVRYRDHSVYEALKNIPAGPNINPSIDIHRWIKVINIWVGATERKKYTGSKLVLEYALNKWFDTVYRDPAAYVASPDFYIPKSDIFISTNDATSDIFVIGNVEGYTSEVSNGDYDTSVGNDYTLIDESFSINIPVAVWASLASTTADRDNIIRNFADKYVVVGNFYSIVTY